MIPGEICPGLRVTTRNREFCGTVSRVTRSRYRKRLLRFWICWDKDDGQEAEYLPGDETYLSRADRVPS